MLPTLIEVGDFRIHTFGVMVAVGFIMGIWWCGREAGRVGADKNKILDLTFWLLISGMLGARILFVIVNWGDYWQFLQDQIPRSGVPLAIGQWLVEMLSIRKGGIVWYGGLLLAFGVGVLFMRRNGLSVWPTSDLVSPGVMLGLAFGRLGCLAAGDDHGRVVESAWETVKAGGNAPWWTLTFTNPQSLIPENLLGKPLYPTQLMVSGKDFLIFAILVLLRQRKTFPGMITWAMMAFYAVARFWVELYRGDTGRGFVIEGYLSTSQAIGAASFAVSVAMLVYLARTHRAAERAGLKA